MFNRWIGAIWEIVEYISLHNINYRKINKAATFYTKKHNLTQQLLKNN